MATRLAKSWAAHPAVTADIPAASVTRRIDAWAGGAKFDIEPKAWTAILDDHLDRLGSGPADITDAVETMAIAASIGRWSAAVDDTPMAALRDNWLRCIDQAQSDDADASATRIILGIELPLTLATTRWISDELIRDTRAYAKSLFEGEGFETCLLQRRDQIWTALASLIRIRALASTDKKIGKRVAAVIERVGNWAVAMSHRDGTRILQTEVAPSTLAEMRRLVHYDRETFGPVVDAVAGRGRPKAGTLAWEVGLPEACWIDGDAGLGVLVPAWDRRRGRTHVDFTNATIRMECWAGRHAVIDGQLQTCVRIDNELARPDGPWELLCEYSDDEVHYFELEQPLAGGAVLQRQFMVVRDDDAVMIGDAIIVPESHTTSAAIELTVRLPIGPEYAVTREDQTREMLLCRGEKTHALMIPLSAGEWRVGPSMTTLEMDAAAGQLVWSSRARQRLYAPLWIDLQRRRFKRPRTWRRLTVAENLRLCRDDEAAAMRMQSGSSHWMVYRSLVPGRMRTVLGKHMMQDFFASRFDPGDGVHEELVSVDDA